MVARLMTFVQGRSGVHVSLAELLVEFINRGICPVVPEHGGVGASGDLVQLAHVALALIGEGEVFFGGERRLACEVLEECGLEPLRMYGREGLAVTNGTAVMTGIGLVNLVRARRLLDVAVRASVMVNEVVDSYDDFMHEAVSGAKLHAGQREVAARMRELAGDSKRMRRRETMYSCGEQVFSHKLQPYYSLRCVPQILGPVWDAFDFAERVLVGELNSVDDNPIVDPEVGNVLHGGNFHGDYVSFEMDKVKMAVTKMTMLVERQMNYLFHSRLNEMLPPFLNTGVLGLNYALQALQFTATSTTAECQALANPMYVHSIPNNNDNQDVVSMGTNSALLARRVVDNGFQVMAIHLLALAQAVDCLGVRGELCSSSASLYDDVRSLSRAFDDVDVPRHDDIGRVIQYLRG